MERILPELDDTDRFFWQSGEDGHLRFKQCIDCHYFIHPPVNLCPKCMSRKVQSTVVSGRATIESYTVNYHAWKPNLTDPYVIAIVTMNEQSDLRLTTNIINCPIESVHIGMIVEVIFEHNEDVYLPLFQPECNNI